ncbi:MAG TPA: hypothetical protein PKO33_06330 [Pyrinomonadaceae bacterium]|nr:hypothetical protein [Pyrinomonadaceae bacterium]
MMITLKQLSAPNSAFPNFLPTYTDDCAAVGSGQLSTCVVTDSFVNKSNGNPPNSILKIVTTIENFDPDRRNQPQVSDFPTTVLDASERDRPPEPQFQAAGRRPDSPRRTPRPRRFREHSGIRSGRNDRCRSVACQRSWREV